jgi:hypothetical protein
MCWVKSNPAGDLKTLSVEWLGEPPIFDQSWKIIATQ